VPHALPESELPLVLPEVDKFLPTADGEPPLARAANWTYEGHPLETTTMAERVFIAGEAMPTESRQTKLRDRYRRLGGPLPQGYAKP
jgi:leucyl-tRNA synthetase